MDLFNELSEFLEEEGMLDDYYDNMCAYLTHAQFLIDSGDSGTKDFYLYHCNYYNIISGYFSWGSTSKRKKYEKMNSKWCKKFDKRELVDSNIGLLPRQMLEKLGEIYV